MTPSNTVGYYFKVRTEGNLIGIVTPYGLGVVHDLAKDAKKIYAGCVTETGTNLVGNNAARYDNSGKFSASGQLAASVTGPSLELVGSFTDAGGGSPYTFSGMTYNSDLSDLPASLSELAGHYVYKDSSGNVLVDAKITVEGGFTLVTGNCTFTGPVTTPDPTLNLYRLADIKSTCASKPDQTDALGIITRLVFPKTDGTTQQAIFFTYLNNAKAIPMLLMEANP